MHTRHDRRGYQILLVALLSLTFGVVFFDRNAMSFLMPFVAPDLGLTNTQIGMLSAALSFTWAISGILLGAASDRANRRKLFLVTAVVAFSLCSVISGFAGSFLVLLGTRLLMGAAEGPILPISQSITAAEIEPRHRGMSMGIVQNFGSNLLGSFLAPVLLVSLAAAFGWRVTFYLAAVPGLLCALLIAWLIHEPLRSDQESISKVSADRISYAAALAERNIVLCACISVLLIAYLTITWAFMPLYLTKVRGYSAGEMSWLMAALGLSAAVSSIIVPGASDRIGRKPVMVAAPLLGLILPLAALYYEGSSLVLAAIFFVGWFVNGCFPLFMATIPSETVTARFVATALGLVMGTGELIGGVGGPILAGAISDAFTTSFAMWFLIALTGSAALLSLGLKETLVRVSAVSAHNQGVSA